MAATDSVLVLCLASNALGQQQHTPIVLQDLGRATLPLDGDWQFHERDDLAWASPGYDDSAWQPIQVGRSWEGQGHRLAFRAPAPVAGLGRPAESWRLVPRRAAVS